MLSVVGKCSAHCRQGDVKEGIKTMAMLKEPCCDPQEVSPLREYTAEGIQHRVRLSPGVLLQAPEEAQAEPREFRYVRQGAGKGRLWLNAVEDGALSASQPSRKHYK